MQYLINGQQSLSGIVSVSGAKNAALKLIIGALLLEGRSRIENVPRIRDITALVEIINFLGGEAKFVGPNTVEVENKLTKHTLPLEVAARTRTSIMLMAPLLFTFGKAVVANPGGCRLGERSVDRLVDSLIKMGASIKYSSEDGYYYAQLENPRAAVISFPKKSHTGTELAVMFASRIEGDTLIENAAQEPEIDDLINLFNQSGADVKRQGETIRIKGRKQLKSVKVSVQSDRIEAVTFIILSALFGGQIKVKNVNLEAIEPFLIPFKKAGFSYHYEAKTSLFETIPPNKITPLNIQTAPHPGFLTDWQPLWVLLMTQAEGTSLVHETVFENRFSYISDLRKFGVKIKFTQPEVANPNEVYQFNNYDKEKHRHQAVLITGPSRLHNGLATMTDIRAGACLVIAALVARGRSVINGAEQIERGYEDLVAKLTRLGAQIEVNSL